MQIECPHCSKGNKLKIEKVVCGECKESLSGFTYTKYSKPFISATTALFIGVFGYRAVDNHFLDEPRYPLTVEHEIIQLCLNSSQRPIARNIYQGKEKICLCALENVMKKIPYDELDNDPSGFLTLFERKAAACDG